MHGELKGMNGESGAASAVVQDEHPWGDEYLARLYDVFPFEADLPLYRELAAQQGRRVLELACGTGRVSIPLAQAGNMVVGVDTSPHMLAVAREKGPPLSLQLLEGDMRAPPVDGPFDLAIIAAKSFSYLCEREDQLKTLSAVAQRLRAGGILALDLLHPTLSWLDRPDGSLHQDLVQYVPERGITVARTETMVSTDLSRQVRTIRSAYEVVSPNGSLIKRFVEWPYRYFYRFEVEHLLERAGFDIEGVFGGYNREQFRSESGTMLFLARVQR